MLKSEPELAKENAIGKLRRKLKNILRKILGMVNQWGKRNAKGFYDWKIDIYYREKKNVGKTTEGQDERNQ